MQKTLNHKCIQFAERLILAGKINYGPWSIDGADKQKMLGSGEQKDWETYGQYFLGINETANEDTEARYSYPVGKDGEVYVNALKGDRSRSAQQKDQEIFDAAGKLLELIESKKPERSAPDRPAEYRELPIEVRESSDNGSIGTFSGTLEFNSLSQDLGGFREMIDPNAFDESLKNGDISALYAHDQQKPLASTRSGTLKITKTPERLTFVGMLPDTSYARDLKALNNEHRQELRGSSFGMIVKQDKWSRDESGQPIRRIMKADLLEISPVGTPAYQKNKLNVREYLPDEEVTLPPEEQKKPLTTRRTAERIARYVSLTMN